MGLRLVTGPTVEPVTLAEAKAQCSLAHGLVDHDAYVTRLIKAARAAAETYTQRAFLRQTWELTLDGFPCCEEIELPRPRLLAIESIEYVDADGETQTLGEDLYQVVAKRTPGLVVAAYGASWPTARCQREAVTVTYEAGYGDEPTSVPEEARQAVLMQVAHWFENREAVLTGTVSKEIELGWKALLDPLRVLKIAGSWRLE